MRFLRADEIEVRVAMVKQNGIQLLLYKDARCDMNILDETFGSMNWERKHELINGNLFCTVSVWDESKKMWISKSDVGTESFTEKEKGQASDSFKRACTNFGIGRELYTSPFIWISKDRCQISEDKGKTVCRDKFKVEKIAYSENGRITGIAIWNESTNQRAFVWKEN